MATRTRRRRTRVLLTGIAAFILAAGMSVTPRPPAYARDPLITGDQQEYYRYYSLKSLHDQGYTGRGTVIAMIDGHVDASVPELAGARIEDKSPCTVHGRSEEEDHGTIVAQILVSPQFGVAPEATLYTYDLALRSEDSGDDCSLPNEKKERRSRHAAPDRTSNE